MKTNGSINRQGYAETHLMSISELIEVASTFDYPVEARIEAIGKLSHHPCKEAVDVILKSSIVDNADEVRRAAVAALAHINPRLAFDRYIQHLKHPNPKVIGRAIEALGQLGTAPHLLEQAGYDRREIAVLLLEHVQHQEPVVRAATKAALDRIAQAVTQRHGKPNNRQASQPAGQGRSKDRVHVIGRSAAYL